MPLRKLLLCLSLLLLALVGCQRSQPQAGQGLSEVIIIEEDAPLPKAMPDKTNVAFVYAEGMREEGSIAKVNFGTELGGGKGF